MDTSLYYNNDGNKVGDFDASSLNKLLFDNGDGVNLMDLNNYNYTFLYRGGNSHFSYDSSKITFIYNIYNTSTNIDELAVLDLNKNSLILLLPNLPNNFISNPRLSLDGKRIFFQADSTWEVTLKK